MRFNWVHQAQDSVQRRVLVNMALYFGFLTVRLLSYGVNEC